MTAVILFKLYQKTYNVIYCYYKMVWIKSHTISSILLGYVEYKLSERHKVKCFAKFWIKK